MKVHESPFPAKLSDLYNFEGKAEMIADRIVSYELFGLSQGRVAGRIFRSLDDYRERAKVGEACGPGLIYAIPRLPSGRESFCPDGRISLARSPPV